MNSKLWKWYIPGHVACLPLTLGYAIFCFLYYRARSWGFRNGVLLCIGGVDENGETRIIGKPGAQTIGACQAYANTVEELRVDLHVHENIHIIEAFVCASAGYLGGCIATALGASPWWILLGGVAGALLYSLVYIGIFLRWYATDQGAEEKPGWHDDYLRNILEQWAYRAQARWKAADEKTKAKAWT